jgi:hypothetical protein
LCLCSTRSAQRSIPSAHRGAAAARTPLALPLSPLCPPACLPLPLPLPLPAALVLPFAALPPVVARHHPLSPNAPATSCYISQVVLGVSQDVLAVSVRLLGGCQSGVLRGRGSFPLVVASSSAERREAERRYVFAGPNFRTQYQLLHEEGCTAVSEHCQPGACCQHQQHGMLGVLPPGNLHVSAAT